MPLKIKVDNISTISSINTSSPMLHNSQKLSLKRSPMLVIEEQLIWIEVGHYLVFNN